MVKLVDTAFTSELAKTYVELISHVVQDVTVEDYKAFTIYIESSDKNITLSPPNFISFLTGISQVKSVEYFLKFEKLNEKLSKRAALLNVH